MKGKLTEDQIAKVNAGESVFVAPTNAQETVEMDTKMKEMDKQLWRLHEALNAAKASGTEADITAAQEAYDSYMEIYEPTMQDYKRWISRGA